MFHQEQDFTFNEPVELNRMAQVLDRNPHLMQMAMRRQPWNPIEEAAGGIVESDPDAYLEVSDGLSTWLEHRKFFTTNRSWAASWWFPVPSRRARTNVRTRTRAPRANPAR